MSAMLRVAVLLAFCLSVAYAMPGIWYAENGSQLLGSTTLHCNSFSLGTYASKKTICGDCGCGTDVPFAYGSNVEVIFDHTLSSVTLNGMRYDIPRTHEAPVCESNDVKAYSLECDSPAVIYRVRGFEDYVCTSSKRRLHKFCGFSRA